MYNDAYGEATQVDVQVEDLLLYIKKERKVDVPTELKAIAKNFSESWNPYVVVENEETTALYSTMKALAARGKKLNPMDAVETLERVHALTKEALAKEKPNFFTMGYYLDVHPDADLSNYSVAEINAMTRAFLDQDFLLDFISMAEKGAHYSHQRSVEKKIALLPDLKAALEYFKAGNIEQSTANAMVKPLAEKSRKAINQLSVKKNSTEYVFHSAITAAVNAYFAGVKNNPVEEKIYLKNKAKFDALVSELLSKSSLTAGAIEKILAD